MHEQDKAILRNIVLGLIDPAGWWIVDGDDVQGRPVVVRRDGETWLHVAGREEVLNCHCSYTVWLAYQRIVARVPQMDDDAAIKCYFATESKQRKSQKGLEYFRESDGWRDRCDDYPRERFVDRPLVGPDDAWYEAREQMVRW